MTHRLHTLFKRSLCVELVLVFVAIISLLTFPPVKGSIGKLLTPQTVYDYRLRMSFDDSDREVNVSTYMPQTSARQTVLSESLQAPGLDQQRYASPNGFIGNWRGDGQASVIDYQALIKAKAYQFHIDPNIPLDRASLKRWPTALATTDVIQVDHAEIAALWQQIKPDNEVSLLAALESIYRYIYELETLPFKGTTDALTALRLGAGSCNGKSRLFVAIARHIGIPARLVGGVILNDGQKRTSHQWLEVNINHQWVPFDPTNGYFAALPAHYLELYVGDEPLFRRTADINFDYYFDINTRLAAPALYAIDADANAAATRALALTDLLTHLDIPPQTVAVLLTLPLCALIITILRNLFGLKSFGVFMPMLIASACTFIGLVPGLVGMTCVVLIGLAAHLYLNRLNMLKIPRLAAVITIVSAATWVLLFAVKQLTTLQVGVLALFPVVIISFLADKLSDLVDEQQWQELIEALFGTLFILVLCYACATSATVLGLLIVFPEAYLLILAAQIYLGRWTGLRVTELIRFRQLIKTGVPVLGINKRNLDYVGGLNTAKGLVTAVDKLETKALLEANGIPTPATVARFNSFRDAELLSAHIADVSEFVIKPNAGSQGNGIVVIRDRSGADFITASGKVMSMSALRNHIVEIINGNFAQHGQQDIAYIEPLIHQHPAMEALSGAGLCDIRIVVIKDEIVSTMLRIPTASSGGKANLHQGALGASIDIETGRIDRCLLKGKPLTKHPDSGVSLIGSRIPHWQTILDMSRACSKVIGLGYLGVDICMDTDRGPLVLELNGRPGLEIQNVTQLSLIADAKPPANTAFATGI